MSNHEKFHVVYDGPALAEHRMDVRDLAPALIAIADLFTAANREVNGDKADVNVEVHASFKAGSFGIDLVAAQQIVAQIRDMFAGNTATAICNASGILGLVTGGGVGLISLLRRLGGKKPVKIEQVGDVARVWITETESLDVELGVLKLYRSKTVRLSLEKTLEPLEREGITDFGIVRGHEVVLDIKAEELPLFRASIDSEEVVSEATTRKLLQIESVAFKDGNKWRVHDGASQFYATVEDADFLARIDAGERFGKGDVLIVDLRQTQTVVGAKLANDFAIVKVIEHREPLQDSLL
ncbi:hypothetical protein [Robbsia andropogonis]|uniref:hypothetical protein n=1 Tax=Robbsia andropogonis TaxID=28092 RepID=UPI0004B68D70|nr:hypothetical protein [Robbsia andropogonis]